MRSSNMGRKASWRPVQPCPDEQTQETAFQASLVTFGNYSQCSPLCASLREMVGEGGQATSKYENW